MMGSVVICWKIRIFAYWTTPNIESDIRTCMLWFAEKFVSLLIEQHQDRRGVLREAVVICWKIRIFAYWTTPDGGIGLLRLQLWFAEKFVSLLIEQHPPPKVGHGHGRCDLLKNSYLCLLNNTTQQERLRVLYVVICWKIRIFAYWTTPYQLWRRKKGLLWFAEKFVSLLIEQHLGTNTPGLSSGCDLLKNSYLCLLNNTAFKSARETLHVVICWKIRIFAYWTTPWYFTTSLATCCDLLKNSYLCLLNNTVKLNILQTICVVICWKIRIFAYWTTPDFTN